MIEDIKNIDQIVFDWVQEYRSPMGVEVMEMITDLASVHLLLPISISAFIMLVYFKKHFEALFLSMLMLGGILLKTLLKMLFARTRPGIAYLIWTDFSFPSGHAMMSFLFFSFLIFLLFRECTSRWYRNLFSFLFVMTILLIGFSRVYLNVHWFSDVLFGYIIAAIWFMVSYYYSGKIYFFFNKNGKIS